MELTPAQLATLKAYINSVPAWAALPNDSDSAFFIAGELNKLATPDYIVWRENVAASETGEAWVGTDIDAMSALNMQRLQLLLASAGGNTFDMRRSDRRAGFENPFGTNQSNGSRVAMRATWKRKGTVLEKVFATGTGSDASPAVTTVTGDIGYPEVQQARSL
jgi:hypothetical protein